MIKIQGSVDKDLIGDLVALGHVIGQSGELILSGDKLIAYGYEVPVPVTVEVVEYFSDTYVGNVDLALEFMQNHTPDQVAELLGFKFNAYVLRGNNESLIVTRYGNQYMSLPGKLAMATNMLEAAAAITESGLQVLPQYRSDARLAVCNNCVYHVKDRCLSCGCFTKLKAMFEASKCPKGYWDD